MTGCGVQATVQHLQPLAVCVKKVCRLDHKGAVAYDPADEDCFCCRVKQALPNLVKELLAPHGLTPSDCCFAVHTGGPKILEKTAAALGVNADSMQVCPLPMASECGLPGQHIMRV